jgi:chromate transporter
MVTYALRLGTLGFGGPVALVGYMHRDLVERRGWISEADYKEGLTLAQLMPGPLAAQLAMYLGYVHYRVPGATLVGVAFVLPSFLMVLALGWAYVTYGGLAWMQSVFYGVGAAVIGIILVSAVKLTRKTIGRDWLLWLIYLVSAATTIVTESEMITLFLGSGILFWLIRRPRSRGAGTAAVSLGAFSTTLIARLLACVTPAAAAEFGGRTPYLLASTESSARPEATDWDTLGRIALFFTKAGAFVFGSGLAIVPFLYGGVVKEYGWLTDSEFLDAVAVAMITPGPVVITVGFIGYIVADLPGASVAALGTFLPCYLFTIIPAPYFKKHGKRPGIVAFVDGVTAAAIGAIAGAVIVLGRRTIFGDSYTPDVFKVLLLVTTVGLLWKFKKVPEPAIVLGAALLGLIVYPLWA